MNIIRSRLCDAKVFAAIFTAVFCADTSDAQESTYVTIPIGSSVGEIGLVAMPNEECRGPAAIAPGSEGGLALLDKVNHKILFIDPANQTHEISLPNDFLEPVDIAPASVGFVVVGAAGDVGVFSTAGGQLTRLKLDYDLEMGAPRLIASDNGNFYLEDPFGQRILVSFSEGEGALPIAEYSTGDIEATPAASGNEVTLTGLSLSGPTGSASIVSSIQIDGARVIWKDPDEGAVVAVQESRRLPHEAAFVRLVEIDVDGVAKLETYLNPDAFMCDTRRPYAKLTDGSIVSLSFGNSNTLAVRKLELAPIGEAEPIDLGQNTSLELISDSSDVFRFLEELHGTPSIDTISLSPVSRAVVIERARAALTLEWKLRSANYSHSTVQNRCEPQAHIWRRPVRLNGLLERDVEGVPYRWGGYVSSIARYQAMISQGSLAGDECTCRSGNYCITPNATGMDCSGFVSFALALGNYFTTSSLPNRRITSPIDWAQLAPGDIANRAGSHVRLVESVTVGRQGRVITVIESAVNATCGGVCRRSYTEAELRNGGYKPLRRLNITN